MQQRTLCCLFPVLLCLAAVSPAAGELQPQHIAVVVNRSSLDSVQVGAHFARQRGVPETHVIPLDLGAVQDGISREQYEQDIVRPLRQSLETRGLAGHIRALVTVYGMPLVVRAPAPTAQERQWAADAQERSKRALHDVQTLAQELGLDAPAADAARDQMQQVAALLERIRTALRERSTHLQSEPDAQKTAQATTELARLIKRVGGQAALVQALRPAPTADAQHAQAELSKLRQQITTVQAMLEALRATPSDLNRQRAYRIAETTFGLEGVLRFAATETEALQYANSDASVDSELSLLWAEPGAHRIAWRSPNLLHYTLPVPSDSTAMGFPMLMVSRLDAPTPALAMQMVDRAVATEQTGLNGTVYIDTMGIHGIASFLSKGAYDQNLRALAELFRRVTSYPVVLEETERTFNHPGEAPDVAVYVGWYRLRAYEDVFTFNPGALGYHIASGEAISVHNPTEPGWCKNALEHGITATLGPTAEPYLDAFPLPGEFFGLLLTGRYSLVEAYYLTTRYVSWRMVLFGDPLYNPWRGKQLASGEHLALQPMPGRAPGELPVAPADRPFPEPLQARHQWQQRRQALLAQVDTLMHELVRREQAEGAQSGAEGAQSTSAPQEDKGKEPPAETKTKKGKAPGRAK
jgi:uncharacterized protein (TIGR03790 family)